MCLEGRRGGSNGVPRDPRRAQLEQQLGAGSSCDLTCFLLATGQGGNYSEYLSRAKVLKPLISN